MVCCIQHVDEQQEVKLKITVVHVLKFRSSEKWIDIDDTLHFAVHIPKLGNPIVVQLLETAHMNQSMRYKMRNKTGYNFNVNNEEKESNYQSLERITWWITLIIIGLTVFYKTCKGLSFQPQTEIYIEIKNRTERVILHWGFLLLHPVNYRIRKVRLPLGNMVLQGLKLTQNMQIRFVENETKFEDDLDEFHYIGVWNALKIRKMIAKNYYLGIIMTNPTKTFCKIDRMQIIENWYRVKPPLADLTKWF